MNVLLCVSGSVAAKLTTKIVSLLLQDGHDVKTVVTKSALHFIDLDDFTPNVGLFDDDAEWKSYHEGKTVLHIDLVKWADTLVIAPCTASTLAKISNGIADGLLTSCARAWDFRKPVIIAPAMNTQMWHHPLTNMQLRLMKAFGACVVNPQAKTLYCGDTGVGALADISDIIKEINFPSYS
jgi:phosphopantothenoylcysteine decarboxylase